MPNCWIKLSSNAWRISRSIKYW